MYMREVEPWLLETGWGCDILDAQHQQEEDIPEDIPENGGSDLEESESGLDGGSEPFLESDEGDVEVDELYLEPGEGDDEDEILDDEDTMEGEYGYSIF